MAVSVPCRLFTVDEYSEMARVGILKRDEPRAAARSSLENRLAWLARSLPSTA